MSFNTTPGDAATWLPPGASDKLKNLRQHVADLRALCPAFEDRHSAANDKIAAENALKRLRAHPSAGGFGLSGDDPRVVAAKQRLSGSQRKARAERARCHPHRCLDGGKPRADGG